MVKHREFTLQGAGPRALGVDWFGYALTAVLYLAFIWWLGYAATSVVPAT